MKKILLDLLKARYEGVSEAILGRVADKLAKTVMTEEQAKTAVEGVTFSSILESYGDSRATEATQTAISNYEKKYGLKDGAKVDSGGAPTNKEPTNEKTEDGDVPDWAKNLIESNKQLNERLNSFDKDRTTASRRQQLLEVVNRLPESLRKGYERTAVSDISEEAFNVLLGEITEEVKGIVSETQQKGAVFGRPTNGGSPSSSGVKEASEEEVKAIVDRMGI